MWFGFKVITLVDSNQSNYFENVGVAVPQVGNEGIWDGGARYLHKLIEKQV